MSETEQQSDRETWLKPEQVDKIREAARSDAFKRCFRRRNDAIIALLYDSGLRVSELTNLTMTMYDSERGALEIPGHIQKDYPNDNTPGPARILLGQDRYTQDTNLTLKEYLHDRWKDSMYLFPSKNKESMSPRGVRRMVKKAAVEADVTPQRGFLQADGPEDVTPHTFRRSVAYRMLSARDEGNKATMYDVRNRLRHAKLRTTEEKYDHFDSV